MLVLFETAAGFAVFKLLNEKKLKKIDKLYENFETPELASSILQLTHFRKFKDTTEALEAAAATVEGKMSKSLKKLMKKLVSEEIHEELAVAEAKLGNVIKEKFNIACVANNSIQELMRCIRSQADGLISGLTGKENSVMVLGLAHSLSRYKLKFSPDKVDTMIVQAVGLLDDLDKELNNYLMRVREWYGWHFPELGKLITDNLAFVKTVQHMGFRTNAATCDLSTILPEELEQELKSLAEISMGSEISDDDISQIKELCDEVIGLTEYRAQLYDYLKNRMIAVAPNLTVLVGELVGARLISHAGSLLNLAKHPASTVQILGAEKALFRALKTKHDTPKYGLIYHASLIGQSNVKNKGKISRMLAAKAALAIRVDALGEDGNIDMGINAKAKVERRIKYLDDNNARKSFGAVKGQKTVDKWENKSFFKIHDPSKESTLPTTTLKRKKEEEEVEDDSIIEAPKAKKLKCESITIPADEIKIESVLTPVTDGLNKKKKKNKFKIEELNNDVKVEDGLATVEALAGPQKKKKKIKVEETDAEKALGNSEKKEKKKKRKLEENLD